MKKLGFSQLEKLEGGDALCYSSGLIVAGAVVAGAIGVATGGVGWLVGAYMGAYFGGTGTLLCAMGNNN